MQKNSVVYYYYIFIVDVKDTWSLFRVKSKGEDVVEVYRGKILSEKYEVKDIVGLAEV